MPLKREMERFKPELGKSVKLLGLTVEQDSILYGYMVQIDASNICNAVSAKF